MELIEQLTFKDCYEKVESLFADNYSYSINGETHEKDLLLKEIEQTFNTSLFKRKSLKIFLEIDSVSKTFRCFTKTMFNGL